MLVKFFDQISFSNSHNNFFEEYCAVLPQFLGRSIRHYRQIDNKQVVPYSPQERKSWYATTKKIVILLSHLTIVIPFTLYIGKTFIRRFTKLQIAPPAILNPNNHQHLKEAQEIRKLREDSHYIPTNFKKKNHQIRLKLPVDSILKELNPNLRLKLEKADPNFRQNLRLEEISKFLGITNLNHDLKLKQEQILAEGFNGFACAHGIEINKGGRKNLLNIMLEGVLRAPYTGGLKNGDPSYSAGPHGPYYVILDPSFISAAVKRKGLWSEQMQVAFLVPSKEDFDFLEKGLNKAVEMGYLIEEEKRRALQKVITYDEFIQLSFNERHNEKKLAPWLRKRSITTEN